MAKKVFSDYFQAPWFRLFNKPENSYTGTMSKIKNTFEKAAALTFGEYYLTPSYDGTYSGLLKPDNRKNPDILQVNGNHKHTLDINKNLTDADTKIAQHKVGEGPIYGDDETQKPFYPRYTLINFIMKVE